ncbi:uncharacterized protein LOC143988068 [Lithobates pipiens]
MCNCLPGRPASVCSIPSSVGQGSQSNQKGPYRPGVASELGKIQPDPLTTDLLSRFSVGLNTVESFSAKRKGTKTGQCGGLSSKQPAGFHKGSDVSTRSPYIHPSSSTVGRATLSSPTNLHPRGVGPQSGGPRHPGTYSPPGKKIPLVVEESDKSVAGSSVAHPGFSGSNHRCKWKRLGGTSGFPSSPGHLGRRRVDSIVQLERIEGSGTSPQILQKGASGSPHSGEVGQFVRSGLSEQTGWHQKRNPVVFSNRDSVLGRDLHPFALSRFPEGREKRSSRFSQPKEAEGGRLGSQPGGLQSHSKEIGVSGGGPVRVQRQCKNPLFFLPKKGRGSSRGGCLEPGLAFRNLLCLPTSSVVASSSEEVSDGKHISDSGGSTLAKESMVLSTKTVGDRTSPALATSGRSPLSGASPMPTGTPVEVSGLATEEGLLRSKGFSEKLVSTLLDSRKKETRQIYERVWLRFNKWCAESSFSVRSSSAVLEFLQRGADKGLSISTLRGQVSALSVFLEDHLATNPWVVRFFRALSRQRPVQGLSFPRWDLSLVLQSLTGPPFEPLKECFLRELTLKTVFLVAVTTARRVSEMEALSVRAPFCVILPDRIVLKTDPAFLPKVASSFHRSQEIVLPSFCPNPSGEKELRFHYLDVRRCILHYLELTKAFRRSDSLFVLFSGARKGCKASRRTIARWLRVAIEQAYSAAGKEIPVGIKAHSTRAMAASQAERAGATPEQICKAATWSSYSTFVKHYRVDLVSAGEQTFGRKVLQAVVPP